MGRVAKSWVVLECMFAAARTCVGGGIQHVTHTRTVLICMLALATSRILRKRETRCSMHLGRAS